MEGEAFRCEGIEIEIWWHAVGREESNDDLRGIVALVRVRCFRLLMIH